MWPAQSNVGSGQVCKMVGDISLPHGTDVNALLTAALAAGATVIEISERIVISVNTVIPTGIILWFHSGGRLSIDTGITVSITGTVIAPRRQIFFGGGTVNSIKMTMPEWFGAKRDAASDDGVAINLALRAMFGSSLSDGQELLLSLSGGTYAISTRIDIFAISNRPFRIRGAGKTGGGTRFLALSTAPAGDIVMNIRGAALDNSSIIDVVLDGFAIISQVPGTGMTTGLRIGDVNAATRLIGVGYSLVNDVYIENFGTGIDLVNTRLFKFERVDVWNTGMVTACAAVDIRISGASNCGDFIFDSCQLVMPDTTVIAPIAGQYCVRAVSQGGNYAGGSTYIVSGVKFRSCNLYGGDRTVRLYCADGARLSEFSFTDLCQNDQRANRSFDIECEKNGGATPVIETIIISGGWISQTLSGAIVAASTGAGGIVRGLSVTGTTINQAQAEVLNLFDGVAGAIKATTFNDNKIYDANNHNGGTGVVVQVGASYDTFVQNNVFTNVSAGPFYDIAIEIGLGAVGSVVGNNNTQSAPPSTAILQDNSGAVAKIIGTNI